MKRKNLQQKSYAPLCKSTTKRSMISSMMMPLSKITLNLDGKKIEILWCRILAMSMLNLPNISKRFGEKAQKIELLLVIPCINCHQDLIQFSPSVWWIMINMIMLKLDRWCLLIWQDHKKCSIVRVSQQNNQ